jgi:hypothetical protein
MGLVDMNRPDQMILDFLEYADPNIRADYSDFRAKKLDPDPDIQMTTLDQIETNRLFQFILNTQIGIQQIKSGRPELVSWDALAAAGLCYFITTLEDTDIVDPRGDTLSQDITDLYATDFVSNPENFWDIYYEMEVAAHFVGGDLSANPINESAIEGSGADVYYRSENEDFIVECKNKRESTPHEWDLEKLGRKTADTLWNDLDIADEIGEGSFAIEISTEEEFESEILRESDYRKEFIKTLAGNLAYLIVDAESETLVFEYDDREITCELVGYHGGRYEKSLSEDQMENLQRREVIQENGHGVVHFEDIGDNTIEIFNTYAINFDIPWDIPYHDWVYSTINRIPEQHQEEENILAFVKIEPGIINVMKQETVENHRGESVSKWERLEEKIIGIFANECRSDRLASVVLTTNLIFDEVQPDGRSRQLRQVVKNIPNLNREGGLPREFEEFIEQKPQIDESLEKADPHGLKRYNL